MPGKKCSLLVFLFFCIQRLHAADFFVERKLNDDFLIYNDKYGYVNYTGSNCDLQNVSFFLPSNIPDSLFLRINSSGGYALFIDNKMAGVTNLACTKLYSVGSLRKFAFGKVVFITICSATKQCVDAEVGYSVGFTKFADSSNHNAISKLVSPHFSRFRNLYTAGFVVILLLTVFIKQTGQYRFFTVFNGKQILFSDESSLRLFRGLLNVNSFFYTLFSVAMLSFYIWYAELFKNADLSSPYFIFDIRRLCYISLAVVTVMLIRLFTQFIFGQVLNLTRTLLWLYNEFILSVAGMLILTIPAFLFLLDPRNFVFQSNQSILLFLGATILAVALIRNLVNDLRFIHFRKVFLFSYICVSDILITLVAVKIVIS